MQRLVIPVDDNIAQTWENAAPAQREQIIKLFSWLLAREEWQNFSPQEFTKLLDRLSDKATANGLTPDLLTEAREEAGKSWQEKNYTNYTVDQWVKGE